jgi:hypothetical protein
LRNSLPTEYNPGQKIGRRKSPEPLSRFSGTEVEVNLDHFHPFGSPVYVLKSSLQSLKSHNKWEDRSRVGIFMCHLPNHESSVPLVLNTQSGNVFSQFHCIYDDDFSTCKRDAKFRSLWQFKAKLQSKTITLERINALPTVPPSVYDRHNINVPVPPPAPDPVDRFVEPWDQVADEPDEAVPPTAETQQPNNVATNEPQPGAEIAPTPNEPTATTSSGRQIFWLPCYLGIPAHHLSHAEQ